MFQLGFRDSNLRVSICKAKAVCLRLHMNIKKDNKSTYWNCSCFSDVGRRSDDIMIAGDFDIDFSVFPFVMLGKFSLMASEDLAKPYHD